MGRGEAGQERKRRQGAEDAFSLSCRELWMVSYTSVLSPSAARELRPHSHAPQSLTKGHVGGIHFQVPPALQSSSSSLGQPLKEE